MIRLAASAAVLLALLAAFVGVAGFVVRSEASAVLVLAVAAGGLAGLHVLGQRRRGEAHRSATLRGYTRP